VNANGSVSVRGRAASRIAYDGGKGASSEEGSTPAEEMSYSLVGRRRRTHPDEEGKGKRTSRRGKTVVRRRDDIARVIESAGCDRECDPEHSRTKAGGKPVVVDHRTRVEALVGADSIADRDKAGPPVAARTEWADARHRRKSRMKPQLWPALNSGRWHVFDERTPLPDGDPNGPDPRSDLDICEERELVR
jgi:hypothetical protein